MPSRWLFFGIALFYAAVSLAQDQSSQTSPTTSKTQPSPSQEAQPETPGTQAPASQNAGPGSNLSASDRAWNLLSDGVQQDNVNKRATAVRVLSMLLGNKQALKMAMQALNDDKPAVQAAAAYALGELHDKSTLPALKKALADKDNSVIIASANALLKFKDPAAYKIFYAVLTGEMKGGKGLIASQVDQLKDPKQMAIMGFQEGIGFIPYAGMGYDAYRAIRKDDSSPVRSAAARALLNDPDPITEDALVQAAVADKSEVVRNAALSTLSKRGNPKLIERLSPALNDDKDSVKYSAAATIVHLTDIKLKPSSHPAKTAPKTSHQTR